MLLDRLEQAGGPADQVPSADGWELVLAENVAYLVDDQQRWRALAKLRAEVGLAPEQILAAPEKTLAGIVTGHTPPCTDSAADPGRNRPDASLSPTARAEPPRSAWASARC